ncbi:hypothetical protein BDW02DRAFT_571487 [Decorospora gaudefroyi]|uniref:Uncharacterized protein n=1 Tax=Decorospora gaudefroyi TaxID=184978 RepID=A0A6A5K6K2_9PLEO|nr:hypothetical protein BDW02DRAFT_571487 [Decorospora gaudefroyi]
MPPIPIHKNAPIAPTTTTSTTAASKPEGITPSTAASNTDNQNAHLLPTRTTPAYAPATTTQDASSSPPAPQPGARPAAPTSMVMGGNHNTMGYAEGDRPAAPQPGPTPTATVITTETRRLDAAGPPPQSSHLPPPSDSYLAGRSTTTTTTAAPPSKPGPTTLHYGPPAAASSSPFQASDSEQEGTRRSLEHPPGYVQAPDNAPYTAGGGIGGPSGEGGGEENGEGVGAQAWQMLSKAGEALKKGEESVWRAVRNKNGGGF